MTEAEESWSEVLDGSSAQRQGSSIVSVKRSVSYVDFTLVNDFLIL